jgi:transketolase C-terminal domain/subunit
VNIYLYQITREPRITCLAYPERDYSVKMQQQQQQQHFVMIFLQIGKAHVLKQSDDDKVLVIGAGITLYEALTAAEELAKSKIHIRVMDIFTVKPVDASAIIKHANECGGRIITVEDHYPEGKVKTV